MGDKAIIVYLGSQVNVKNRLMAVFLLYFCFMRMTISGLPKNFDKFDLQRLFNPYGWVDYTKILIDPISGLSRGRGIVEMKRDDDAKKAMAALQGKVLDVNPLNIKEAKERRGPEGGYNSEQGRR